MHPFGAVNLPSYCTADAQFVDCVATGLSDLHHRGALDAIDDVRSHVYLCRHVQWALSRGHRRCRGMMINPQTTFASGDRAMADLEHDVRGVLEVEITIGRGHDARRDDLLPTAAGDCRMAIEPVAARAEVIPVSLMGHVACISTRGCRRLDCPHAAAEVRP